jgi:hypothetical protein
MRTSRNSSIKHVGLIEQENKQLKDMYNYYHGRLDRILSSPERSKRGGSSKSFVFIQKKELNSRVKKLGIMSQERKKLMENRPKLVKNTAGELWLCRQQLEEKIQKALQENERLKQLKKDAKNEKSQDGDEIREYLQCKKNFKELEKKHEKLARIVQEINEKSTSKQGVNEALNLIMQLKFESENEQDKLAKHYEILKKSYVSNEKIFRNQLKDYEILDQKLSQNLVYLKMKLLKSTQQERLLEITTNLTESSGVISQSSMNTSFLYKPSLKSLYI